MPNKLLKQATFEEKAGGECPAPDADAPIGSDGQEDEFDKFLELSAIRDRLKIAIATLEGLVQALQDT